MVCSLGVVRYSIVPKRGNRVSVFLWPASPEITPSFQPERRPLFWGGIKTLIVCGWCKVYIGLKSPLEDKRETHGICSECEKEQERKLKEIK